MSSESTNCLTENTGCRESYHNAVCPGDLCMSALQQAKRQGLGECKGNGGAYSLVFALI